MPSLAYLSSLQSLKKWAVLERGKGETVVVFARPDSLESTVASLADVKLLIGPHGGAMYNAFYAPKHMAIIEFAPTMKTYHSICRCVPQLLSKIVH